MLEHFSGEDRSLIESFIKEVKNLIPSLSTIVLYGSMARGDYHKDSDIDVLLVIEEEKPNKYLPEVTKIISSLKPHREIRPVLTNLKDVEYSLINEVLRDGVVLFGKIVVSPDNLGLRPYQIISYDLSNVNGTVRARVARRIYGYTSRKKIGKEIKEYKYEGLVSRRDCFVLGKGVIALPKEDANGFKTFLERNKVTYKTLDIWV
ncbi:MAG: nucleotidyltransferase domain-containing protein [Candidatus Hydrothermarchaeota archaeon]